MERAIGVGDMNTARRAQNKKCSMNERKIKIGAGGALRFTWRRKFQNGAGNLQYPQCQKNVYTGK
jgi:hypothetical protein